jgi:hypothetical protein
MRPILVIVADVFTHQPLQVPLVRRNQAVQQIPATVANRALSGFEEDVLSPSFDVPPSVTMTELV